MSGSVECFFSIVHVQELVTLKRWALVDVGVPLEVPSAIVPKTAREGACAPQNSGDGAVCGNYSQRDGG
jgi:hypothetical protein